MNTKILGTAVAVMVAGFAHATIYTGGSPSTTGLIPDGNVVGMSSTISMNTSGDDRSIAGVSLTLNLSGGYNGDLYGYLVNPNGNLAVVLNRVGTGGGNIFGYSDAGMNLILSDAGMPAGSLVGNIHTYQTVGGYDITSGAAAWSPDNATMDFAALHNASGNGTWTLFLADLSGGSQSTLVSWGLSISVVPEPTTWALMAFVGVMGLVAAGRWHRQMRGAVTK